MMHAYNAITFEILDVENSFLARRYVFQKCRSRSYIEVKVTAPYGSLSMCAYDCRGLRLASTSAPCVAGNSSRCVSCLSCCCAGFIVERLRGRAGSCSTGTLFARWTSLTCAPRHQKITTCTCTIPKTDCIMNRLCDMQSTETLLLQTELGWIGHVIRWPHPKVAFLWQLASG